MSASERVKGLLDGTVDPSELEGDPELYSLAERIYGREALDEMGIAAPVVATVNYEEPDYSNGNNLEVEIPEVPQEQEKSESPAKSGSSRIPLFTGIIGLMIVVLNMTVGMGALIDLCEDPPSDLPIEFNTVANLQDSVLHVSWTISNMDPASTYTVEWTISENGSQIVVDTDSFAWSSQDTYIHTENAMIQQSPWCYISTLFENGTMISSSNGCENDVVMETMSEADSMGGECKDNPRLIWSDISEYEELDSWAPAGSGDLIDGALLTLFGIIILSRLRRSSDD